MAFWPLAVFALPILLGIGLLWLRTKFPDLTSFNKAVGDVVLLQSDFKVFEVRLEALERAHEEEPTRSQVIDRIGDVVERLSRLEAGIEAVTRTQKTQGDWIQALAMPEARR